MKRLLFFAVTVTLSVMLLSLSRLYFLVEYNHFFKEIPFGEIILSFLNGIRFDLSTACIFTGGAFVLLYFPFLSRYMKLTRIIMYSLLLWYASLFLYTMIDINYYAFVQRHITYELQDTWREADVIFKIAIKQYPVKFLAVLVFMGLFGYGYIKGVKRLLVFVGSSKNGVLAEIAIFILVVGMSIVFIRGGFQSKPIMPSDAYINEKTVLGHLGLNGLYTTFRTLYYKERIHEMRFVPEDEAARTSIEMIVDKEREKLLDNDYPLLRRFDWARSDRRKLNVVIFVMESWPANFIKGLGGTHDAAPFFDELSEEGLVLKNCYANAQRSIEGFSAIFSSVPSWSSMPMARSGTLNQVAFKSFPALLKEYGYTTLFIRGARFNSQGIGSFAKQAGFEKIIAREDFDAAADIDDGVWGIYDEFLYLRAHEEFEEIKRPFLGVVFHVSTHPPYTVPSEQYMYFDDKVPYFDFLNTMRYSDHMLRLFFDRAKRSQYFRDTLFIIVSDHTEGRVAGGSVYNRYRIPCLFYSPGYIKPGVSERVTSQLDIMPSIIDFLRLDAPYAAFGRSVFPGRGKGHALLPAGGSLGWVSGKHILVSNLDVLVGLYDYSEDPLVNILSSSAAVAETLKRELLSYLQFTNNTVIRNRLYPIGGRDMKKLEHAYKSGEAKRLTWGRISN